MNMEDVVEKPLAEDTVRFATEIVATYVANNLVVAEDIPNLIRTVHQSLAGLGESDSLTKAHPEKQKPAVPVSRSLQHDHIVCLEDGQRLTMLKRYLRSRYDMSPEDYRRKWGLPPEYPMVAPAYASRRSAFAKSIGLGKGVRRKANG